MIPENNDEPRLGKDVNRKAEQDFFASVKEFHGAEITSTAVNGDWKDGKISSERFYYNKA